MCDYDCESPDVQVSKLLKAAKEHVCVACNEKIYKGDKYHQTKTLFDGCWDVFNHCLRCYLICLELWKAGATQIDLHLDCGEVWEDNFGELPSNVAALAFITKEEMPGLIEKIQNYIYTKEER